MSYGLILALAGQGGGGGDAQFIVVLLLALIMLLVTIALYATAVKRLHDYDTTGWWSLLTVVPVVSLIFLVVIGVPEGEGGDNAYGPEPA